MAPNSGDIRASYEYDDSGNRVEVTDAKGARTGFKYDGLARNTHTIWDLGTDGESTKQLTYDAVVLTQRIDERNQITDYAYDGLHRLETVDYVGSSFANRVYGYDKIGNIETVTETAATDVAYTYDALNRIITETSQGVTHTYVYDKAGNRRETVYGLTDRTIVSTYDALNRLDTCAEDGRVTAHYYDLNGNIVQKALANDVLVECTYDALNRKRTSSNTTSGAAQPFTAFIYSYDAASNLREIDESYPLGNLEDRLVTNTYDHKYRLDTEEIITQVSPTVTSTTLTDYDYDDVDNRLTKTVTVDTPTPTITIEQSTYGDGTSTTGANSNQLTGFTKTGAPAVSYSYDANGNRETRTQNGQTDTYSYDYENRLIDLVYQTGSSDTGTYLYGYDYRTRRTVRDESQITGREKELIVFSGGTSVQEHVTTVSATPSVEYIRGSDYGGGIGGILYTLRSGAPSFKHYNSRGDVVAATDASGSLTYQAAYEAFGKHGDTSSSQEWGATLDRQQANTKDEDPTGLLNEGFRYRDLETGTFITRDPLGFVDGPNVYTYVVQNPWTKFDPLGLQGARTYSAAVNAAKAQGRENMKNTLGGGLAGVQNFGISSVQAVGFVLSGGEISSGHMAPWRNAVDKANASVLGIDTNSSQYQTAKELTSLGLEVAAAKAAAGKPKDVTPESTARPKGVPEDWVASPSKKKGGGIKYTNPDNPHQSVRDMPGNPNSPNAAQQKPYVKQMNDGSALDVDGNPVPADTAASHIPAADFKFKPPPPPKKTTPKVKTDES
jgi:RHS repeat-associated protein